MEGKTFDQRSDVDTHMPMVHARVQISEIIG